MRSPLTALLSAVCEEKLPSQIVSLVGAGGKTSLMFALARLLTTAGEHVVCTTTTKILAPTSEECPCLVLTENQPICSYEALAQYIRMRLQKEPFLTLADSRLSISTDVCANSETASHSSQMQLTKLQGLTPKSVTRLANALPEVRFLVEADGAARKPLKAPEAYEPVFPAGTGCCIGVIGLDCLGKRLDTATVHRLERLLAVTGQQPGSSVTLDTLARLTAHPEGMFRNCPSSARRVVFCNKAELLKDTVYSALQNAERNYPDWFAGSVREGWCMLIQQES